MEMFIFPRALVHESELARNEPDSQVHHLVRSKYSADPQVSIVQQVVTVTANRSQALVEPQCFPPLRLST